MFDKYPDVLSIEQVMQALGIGKNTVYKLIQNRKLCCIRIGRKYIVPKIFLIDFIEACR